MKLRVQKAVYGGAGLARIAPAAGKDAVEDTMGDAIAGSHEQPSPAGKTVFIPYVLPGELVEAHITGNRRGYATAEVDSVADSIAGSILEPSPERVAPGCEYFPACGGCQYQHANAAYQLRMKLDILRDTLERAHLASHLGSLTINGLSGQPWSYRNRIRLRMARRNGALALCYRERGSHRNLPVTHCPIASPLLNRAIAAVLKLERESGLTGLCDEIEFFANNEEDALLVSLWTSSTGRTRRTGHGGRAVRTGRTIRSGVPDGALQEFAEQLRCHLPELAGAGLFSAEDREGRAEGLLSHWGRRSLTYTVSGDPYQVSLGSFFQVNRFLLPQLVSLVTGNRSGRSAWDLYAGVGLFARALDFEQVTAVEAALPSSEDLKQNLAGTSHRAVRSTALDFLRSRQGQGRRGPGNTPNLILLDPPRAGLGEEVCARLVEAAAPEMVYVSCDPATLARDLQTLLRSGYRLKELHLVDLFPQTFHLETVARLAQM